MGPTASLACAHSRGTLMNLPASKTTIWIAFLLPTAFLAVPAASNVQTAPTFAVAMEQSSVKFFVKASMSVTGTFDKWNANLTFASDDAASGVLDIKIQANSVNTGSGLKDRKMKGDDFFAADKYPQLRR